MSPWLLSGGATEAAAIAKSKASLINLSVRACAGVHGKTGAGMACPPLQGRVQRRDARQPVATNEPADRRQKPGARRPPTTQAPKACADPPQVFPLFALGDEPRHGTCLPRKRRRLTTGGSISVPTLGTMREPLAFGNQAGMAAARCPLRGRIDKASSKTSTTPRRTHASRHHTTAFTPTMNKTILRTCAMSVVAAQVKCRNRRNTKQATIHERTHIAQHTHTHAS